MTRAEIFAVLQESISHVVDHAKPLAETDTMDDVGADSLEVVEIIARSMKQLDIRISSAKLWSARSLGDLVTLFEDAVKKSA